MKVEKHFIYLLIIISILILGIFKTIANILILKKIKTYNIKY